MNADGSFKNAVPRKRVPYAAHDIQDAAGKVHGQRLRQD